MKLALGTAQLGMDYGVTNRRGQPSPADAGALLKRAYALGIGLIDTAPVYGTAEDVVGDAIRAGCAFHVVTKVPPMRAHEDAGAAARRALHASLARLAVGSLYGVLLHRCQDALGPQGGSLIEAIREARRDGLVERVGVSVYRASDIDEVLQKFTPDIVQVPLSALDQRLVESGHLKRLRGLGVEIHARSAFMQGVMLSPPEALPPSLQALCPALERFRALARGRSLSELEAAIAFVAQTPEVSALIVGVTGADELDAVTRAFRRAEHAAPVDFAALGQLAPRPLLDLDRWPPAAARRQ